MKRVVHLIPYDGIGGVEVAAKSIPTGTHKSLVFERQYLVRRANERAELGEYHGPDRSLFNPLVYLHALTHLLRQPPDLLIASLWRSAIVLIAFKLLRPRSKTVIFLHLPSTMHGPDRILNLCAMYLSTKIWADSAATLQGRVPARLRQKGEIISFLTRRSDPPALSGPAPDFIFWGRLTAQKGLGRALRIFAKVRDAVPAARFTIIGPDGGCEADLKAVADELRIRDSVHFIGGLPHAEIGSLACKSSFYLQTSLDEGMALSVTEAMQFGLVPIVTPVGEIARYCQDGVSAIFVEDDDAAVDAVLSLLSSPERFRSMAKAAANYWQDQSLYKDDILTATRSIFGFS